MTNAKKYIIKRGEYDLLLTIKQRTDICPIWAIGGDITKTNYDECYGKGCGKCLQQWLNEEAIG